MTPPVHAKLFETTSSSYWFDEEGILCSVTKKTGPPTLEETKRIIHDLKEMLQGKKVCILIDVTHSPENNRETRSYAAIEFPKFMKAMALVSKSALGRMLANLFFNITQQPYPVKMFNEENEARKWLRQYL